MRNLSFEQSKDILLEIARTCDGKDRWLLEAFGTGCTGKEPAMFRYLVAKMNIDGADLARQFCPPGLASSTSPMPFPCSRTAP